MRKKKNFTILGIGILNLILTVYVVVKNIVTKMVPINIFASDLVGKMSPKYLLVIAPIAVMVISIIQVIYRLNTMDKPVTTGKLIEDALFTFIDGLLITGNWLFVYMGYKYSVTKLVVPELIEPAYVLLILLGLVIAAIASNFPINKRGSILGLRTKETMENGEIWRLANRFNGFTNFVSAIIIILLAFEFIIAGFNLIYLIVAAIICVILMFVVPRIYAKLVAKKVEQ